MGHQVQDLGDFSLECPGFRRSSHARVLVGIRGDMRAGATDSNRSLPSGRHPGSVRPRPSLRVAGHGLAGASSMNRTRIAVTVFGLALAMTGFAQGVTVPPLLPQGDLSRGEEREIRQRIDWFERVRGLRDVANAGARRANALALQRARMSRQPPALLASQSWLPMGPAPMTMLGWDMGNVAGRVTAMAVDPADENLIYLGAAAGGLWKSTDGGTSWTQLFDAVGTESIGSVMLEAGNPDHVWAGTGEINSSCSGYFGLGLFYSPDGGTTWESRNGSDAAPLPLSFVTALAQSPADPAIVLAGGAGHCNPDGTISDGGIYRTADGGQAWTLVLAGSDTRDVVFDPTDANVVYTEISPGGLFKSTDAGQTWTQLGGGAPTGGQAGYTRIAIAGSQPATLYSLSGNSNRLKLFRSDDAGATWTIVNTDACEGQCWYNLTLDVAADDPDRVLVGTIRPALSLDGGQTLTILTAQWGGGQQVHQDTHIVRFSVNDDSRFWIGGDGGLWRSDDGGGTFTNLNANLDITQFYDVAIDPADPGRMYGGAQDNSSSVRDDGDVWDVAEVTGDGFMNAVDETASNRVFQTSYPSGGPSLILSTQSGAPNSYGWVSQSGTNGSDPWPWVTPLVTGSGYVFVASDLVYRAPIVDDPNAYQWQPISAAFTTGSAAVSVLTPPVTVGTLTLPLFAGTEDGQIFACPDPLDPAPQWNDITGNFPLATVSDIAVAADGVHVFATRSAFDAPQLLASASDGDWVPLGAGLPALPANAVAIDPLDPGRVFVGTDIGVYESTDAGATFTPFMAGMPLGMVVTDLEISANPHVLVAATYGRGAWSMTLDLPVTDRIFADGFDTVPGRQP